MKIIIPRIIISKLFEHSLLEDPNECCGLLLGNDEKIIEIRNLNNVHDNPMTRYEIDNKDLMKAQKYCDNNNMDILGVYHSHTHSQAYPSPTDIEKAREIKDFFDPYYILISLIEKTRPIIRGYKIDLDSVTEITVEHDGEAYISPTMNF
jgi:proteasome lid subunit RPN8/RPN11